MNESRYINNCQRGIDKKDMICDAISHYKSIILGAILGMVVLTLLGCVYKVNKLKNPSSSQVLAGDEEEAHGLGDVNYLMKLIKDIQYLNDAETVVDEYMANSVLARTDMRYAHYYDISYRVSVDGGKRGDLIAVLEAYNSCLHSTEYYQKVSDSVQGNVKPEYAYELINMSWDEAVNEDSTSTIVKVTTVGPSDEYSVRIAAVTKDYFNACKKKVEQGAGTHSITIISENTRTQYCNDYAVNIAEMRRGVNDRRNIIGVIWSELTPEQIQYRSDYYAGNLKDEAEYQGIPEETKVSVRSYVKAISAVWAIAGLILGALVVIGFWCVVYSFSNVIHTKKELEYLYNGKTLYLEKSKKSSAILNLINKIRFSDMHFLKREEILDIIDDVVESESLEEVVVISSSCLDEIEGCKYKVLSDALINPTSIKQLSKVKNVIVVETLNRSKFSECMDVSRYIHDNEMNVVSVVGVVE